MAGTAALGLSLVRTAWLGFAVGLLAFAAAGRLRLLRAAVVGIAVPLLLLSYVGGPVRDAIMERVDKTAAEGGSDESFLARLDFFTEQMPLVLRDPVGIGLGAVGTATKLSNDQGQLGQGSQFDSGIIEVLYSFGSVLGLVLFAVTVHAVVVGWRRASRGSDVERAMIVAVVGLLVQMPFGNILVAPTGVLLWLFLGLLARQESLSVL